MIDIGVNLTNQRFDKDRQAVIERATIANVRHLIITGTNIDESAKAQQMAIEQPAYLSSTAGVHPHDADNVADDYLDSIEKLAEHSVVKAIGECGLDFNRNFSTPDNQVKVFKGQVALAAKLEKPLFLHQRDAFEPWLAILKPYIDKVPAMVSHCFTGTEQELTTCVEFGMYIGITGWVCDERRGSELQQAVQSLPLDKLLIETDAPYLTPRTIRPKPKSSRNEPSYLPFVVKQLAELLKVSEQEIIKQSSLNAAKVFAL